LANAEATNGFLVKDGIIVRLFQIRTIMPEADLSAASGFECYESDGHGHQIIKPGKTI